MVKVRVSGPRKGPPSRKRPSNGRQSRAPGTIAGTRGSPPQAGAGGPHLSDDTKERLLAAAKKLFAQKGYDGASVKEVSVEAGVNISLVSYHFGGKENLYRACLEPFGARCLHETQRILGPPESAEEFKVRLGLFVEYLFSVFNDEPELSRMAFKEADDEHPHVQDIFQDSFLGLFKMIIKFFEAAQGKSIIHSQWDPHALASLFFGALSHYARVDKIALKYWGRSIRDEKTRARVLWHLKEIFGQGLTAPSQGNR